MRARGLSDAERRWRIELPLSGNDFKYEESIDVQRLLCYNQFFSSRLEATVKAALPSSGGAARAVSMRMWSPDELFYLKSRGEAQLDFETSLFPRNQKEQKRTKLSLQLKRSKVANLVLRLTSQKHGAELALTTDANGRVAGVAPADPLAPLQGEALIDQWKLKITAADNPALVESGRLNLKGIDDVMAFVEYSFLYR
ncbi:MAG: hypothetical protein ABI612_15320 [Betaproteobacteria bacterium]